MSSRTFHLFIGASFAFHAAIALSFAWRGGNIHGVDRSGETFNLPEPIDTEGVNGSSFEEPPLAPSTPPALDNDLSSSGGGGGAVSGSGGSHSPPSAAKRDHHSSTAPASPKGSTAAPAELYGAVGDRSAADVTLSFTSNFPAAASADPIWQQAAFGSAGEALVVITIDESGHVIDSHVSGGSDALRSGVLRTLSLIRGRTFTARQARTAFTVSGKVSPDTVHDGLHGDYFAVGRASQEGSAFFALPTGRRIDIRVRAK